ncbi:cytochrome bc1 complex diheme cytochrome c subunit [Georgenia satyanarayanai]|uniref:cytochrome bc1 complex diheme cytochrome c subunit n=1 Tax=Georgenia satyanarayanai TaxID=860221 RepID=UPI0012651BBC|nr:c-type cytochrome [Georgenia satyanarayanai]
MKALAASRRHRLAPVVLLLLALILTGVAYSAVTSEPANAQAASQDMIEEGEALFRSNCSTCHGLDAQGTDIAPSLVGVGAASVHFQVSTGRMPMANNSPQAERKDPQFNEEQTAAMAAYVASLGPGPAIPSSEQVDPELGDAANGMELFRTNCSMCHNAVGAGGALTEGKVAPPLDDATPTQIWEAMRIGPQSMPIFNEASVTDEGARDVIAYILEQREVSPGGLSLGNLGPVSEGFWVWLVGIGGIIGIAVWMGARSS